MKKLLFYFTSVFLVASSVLFVIPKPASADFNPSNIVSDATFNSVGTMNAATIDAFLNAHNSCISTSSGFSAVDPIGYNPSQGFLYGGNVSAGTVIAHAAQAYGLNPQVLLATLQKEQSLVTSSSCSTNTISKAVGYACPDGGTSYSYTGVNLYTRNGTTYTSVSGICVNSAAKAGFTQQLIRAAWLLKFSQQRALGNINWAVISGNWNNSDDLSSCYTGAMTEGYRKRCPTDSTAVYYDGYTPIDGVSTYMGSGATAALYRYTPHFSGNQNFYNIFTGWFKSSLSVPTSCDSKVTGVVCVWSLLKTDGSQFLTSSMSEMNSAMANFGWTYDGVAFYASGTQQVGTIPVHRLLKNNLHFYTADQSEYNTMMASGTWSDEGIVFYAYPTTTSSSASHTVYRLYNSSNGQYYLTSDSIEEQYLVSTGYALQPGTFSSFSGIVKLPVPAAGRDNIYRLSERSGFFYTTNINELETVINMGYPYDGVVTTANASNTGTPIYRLQRSGLHFYTADTSERDNAVSKYGYTYEGIAFYLDDSSAEIYRLDNTVNGGYMFTSSLDEAMAAANTNGWTFGGSLVSKNTSPFPVYRFINVLNNRHFYTIDINEAMRITNKGWKYETVAFYADKTTGQPVYRLLLYDKHFYTTDINEKNIAMSKYGYQYEGVAFYVSPITTSTPVYRLQGGPDEYFLTVSSTERDKAVSSYGYSYEGIGFYLP